MVKAINSSLSETMRCKWVQNDQDKYYSSTYLVWVSHCHWMIQCIQETALSKPDKCLFLYIAIVINRQNISVWMLGLVVMPVFSAVDFCWFLMRPLLFSLQRKMYNIALDKTCLETNPLCTICTLTPGTAPQTHIQLNIALFTNSTWVCLTTHESCIMLLERES